MIQVHSIFNSWDGWEWLAVHDILVLNCSMYNKSGFLPVWLVNALYNGSKEPGMCHLSFKLFNPSVNSTPLCRCIVFWF